ncbi:MAG: hypothetical protein ACXAEX_19085 [Promethearchaeota archaeon]|jgi:hypothetical protein
MILDRLKEFPSKRILYILTIFGFLLVLLVEIFVFIPIEAEVSTYGILDYEFAWTLDNVLAIFSAWGANGLNLQVIAIYWDFLFIVGYVSLAFGLIILAYRSSGEQIQLIGTYITITPILTGIFDVIENAFLISMATNLGSILDFYPVMASLSASIKFGLLFVGIIYFAVALIIILFKKIKKRKE